MSCIVCCLPRSGSWLLAEALNNTALAGQPEEYFRPDHTDLWKQRWSLRADDPYDRYVAAALKYSTTNNGVFSVKMHWYQFSWFLAQLRFLAGAHAPKRDADLVAEWLPNPRYVYLPRIYKARQAISYWRAERSNVWFVRDNDRRVSVGRPLAVPTLATLTDEAEPDFRRIRWLERMLIEHERRWLAFFDDGGIRPRTVIYEHLTANYPRTVTDLLRWLGVVVPADFRVGEPGLKRQADELTDVLLDRYLAVRDEL